MLTDQSDPLAVPHRPLATSGRTKPKGLLSLHLIANLIATAAARMQTCACVLAAASLSLTSDSYAGCPRGFQADIEITGTNQNDTVTVEFVTEKVAGGGVIVYYLVTHAVSGGAPTTTKHGAFPDIEVVFYGNKGDDRFENKTTLQTIAHGEDGNDVLIGGEGDDTMDGGRGDDVLFGRDGDDTLDGQDGKDKVFGEGGDDAVTGGDGDDTLHGGDGEDTVQGGNGSDTMYGEDDDDTCTGGSGDDRVWGGDGIDTLDGGNGADKLYGGKQKDSLSGGDGMDYLEGGDGPDTLVCGDDEDTARAGNGDDTIDGGDGNDQLYGDNGDDRIECGGGTNLAEGGDGNDVLGGGGEKDILRGDDGDDCLYGRSGTDFLYGGSGSDGLYGGNDLDSLDGGTAIDRILVYDIDSVAWGDNDLRVYFEDGDRINHGGQHYTAASWTQTYVETVDRALVLLHERSSRLLERKDDPVTFVIQGEIEENESANANGWNADNGDIHLRAVHLADGDVRNLLIHEVGHNWDTLNDNWGDWKDISGWKQSWWRPSDDHTRRVDSDGDSTNWWFLRDAEFASGDDDGYSRKNPMEDFAVHFQKYVMNEDMTKAPTKKDFIKEFIAKLNR